MNCYFFFVYREACFNKCYSEFLLCNVILKILHCIRAVARWCFYDQSGLGLVSHPSAIISPLFRLVLCSK